MADVVQEVYERVLDDEGVHALLGDVLGLARAIEVRSKAGRGAMSEALDRSAVADALVRLQRGDLRALQLTYEHAGRRWCDTILALEPGRYRVLRVG